MRYKFGLLFIFIVFIFLEWSIISYSEGPIRNSFGSETVITELADLDEIEQVSRKLTDESEESRIEDLKVKTKTRSGKNSIYVEALQSTVYQRRFPDISKGFSFNL